MIFLIDWAEIRSGVIGSVRIWIFPGFRLEADL